VVGFQGAEGRSDRDPIDHPRTTTTPGYTQVIHRFIHRLSIVIHSYSVYYLDNPGYYQVFPGNKIL